MNTSAPFRRLVATLLIGFAALSLPATAKAVELIMVEQEGCHYCIAWKEKLGPIYPKTEAGKFAPLTMVDIDEGAPEGVTFKTPVVYTPTFILVEDGQELSRIEGYPGEDFFWAILEKILAEKAGFPGTG